MASSARIDELQKKFDENPRRYFAPLANEYRKAGQLDRAIALCREHLPKQPGHMSGHIVYGQALYEAGEPGEARRVFQTALDLDPENVIALRHMGDIDRASGDADEARHWYTRVLDADPRNAEVTALIDSLDAARPAAVARGSRVDAESGGPPLDEPSVLHPEEFEPGAMPSAEAVEINADLAAATSPHEAVPESDPFFGAGADPAFGTTPVAPAIEAGADAGSAPAPLPDAPDAAWPFAEPLQIDGAAEAAYGDRLLDDSGPADDAPRADDGLDVERAGGPYDFADRAAPLERDDPDADALRTQSALEGLVLLEPAYDDAPATHASADDTRATDAALDRAADEPRAFDDLPLDAPLELHADAPAPTAELALDAPLLIPVDTAPADAAPAAETGAVAGTGDAAVPSIDEFAYDAPATADAAARDDAPAAAQGAELLPSIDAYVYETAAADPPDEPASLPSIDEFAFVGPSIDEFLVDEPAATAAVSTAPAAPPAVAEIEPLAAPAFGTPEAVDRVAVDPEPVAEPVAASAAEPAAGSPFVTETMADLYLRQGFRDEALGVYRQLLASDPYNEAISAKVRELTGEFAAAAPPAPPPTARSFFAALASRRSPRPSAPAVPSASAAPVAPAEPPSVAGGGFGYDELDSFVAPPPAAVAGATPDDAALQPIEAYGYDASAADGGEGGGGPSSLDALFGNRPVQPNDAAAASALAAAFTASPGGGAGAPAGGASLDEMFQRADTEPMTVRRPTPTAFSFEQFFTDEMTPPAGGVGSSAAPAARLGEESTGDLEQFNSWLDSLKRK